jgi:hypothetical protein
LSARGVRCESVMQRGTVCVGSSRKTFFDNNDFDGEGFRCKVFFAERVCLFLLSVFCFLTGVGELIVITSTFALVICGSGDDGSVGSLAK